MSNTVYFPEQVIPAHTIHSCNECPNFLKGGAIYGDGDICTEYKLKDIRTVRGEIPNWCPLLKKREVIP